MATINENKFYQALESIFTGASIEGDSGYVNLLKIKSSYYKIILEEFKKSVNNEKIIAGSFKEEFFDKLYSFFEKYFSESGSVYFVKTANWQRVYEQVYTDNKDVVLFWKTHMLYYVKSDILFQSIDVSITDEETKREYNFYFDVGNLQAKQNNEKKSLIFSVRENKEEKGSVDVIKDKKGKKTFVFDVRYSERGTKTKTDDIVKATKIPEAILEKAFKTFKKQSEVDFFINKNAEKFLSEQLDMYLHQVLLDEENKFEQKRLDQLKTIKTFALKIIKLIAQFEDELVRVWNKPKFALNSNYVITLDKLSDEILEKLAKHDNLPDQIKEWQELGMVHTNFTFEQITKNDLLGTKDETYKFLPIDTKYFKDLEIEILSVFDNIDEALDGRLLHSENYQALNTLSEKYKEKVQCIYIDPPYNTGSDGFMYNDKYQHSSWLSFLSDRLELGKNFLREPGSIFVSIGDTIKTGNVINSNSKTQILLNQLFGEENYIANFIRRSSSAPKLDAKFISNAHDYVLGYAKNIEKLILNKKTASLERFTGVDKYVKTRGKYDLNKLDRGSLEYSESLDYEIIAPDGTEIWPNGTQDDKRWIWRWSKDKVQWGIENDYIVFKKSRNGIWQVYYKEYEFVDNEGNPRERENPHHTFIEGIYNEQGNKEIESLFGKRLFEYPKPSDLSKYIFDMGSQKDSLVLDFFGGSGSSVHGAIKCNKEDNGKRKYLLIELDSNNFENTILPRIKKVCFSDKWKDGKAEAGRGISQFFKYYKLEQYEDTLRNMQYKDSSPNSIFDTRRPFEQYIFYADQKFAHVIEVEKDKLELDFDKLYPNIDFAETISNLLGLPIKRITKTSVVLRDGDSEREIQTDYKNMNETEKLTFVRLLKPLLWWGE